MGGSLNTIAPIFTPYPVDPDHPLNRGLRAWWLAIPDLYGGRQWFDLCDRYHFSLTNFTWTNSYRPGGMGQLAGDGASSYGALPGLAEFNWDHTQPFTISAWINLSVINTYHTIFSTLDPANGYRGWELSTTDNFTGLFLYLVNTWTSDAIGVYGGWPPVGSWQHITITWDGSGRAAGCTYYLNGLPQPLTVYTGASGTIVGTMASAIPLRIGSRVDGTGTIRGLIDDEKIYDRVLGPDQAAALYWEGILGYPETLNRIMPRAVRPPTAAFPPLNVDVVLSGAPFGGSLL